MAGSPQPPRRAAPHRVLEGSDDEVARGVIVQLVQPRPRPQRAQGGGGAVAAEAGGEGVAGVQPGDRPIRARLRVSTNQSSPDRGPVHPGPGHPRLGDGVDPARGRHHHPEPGLVRLQHLISICSQHVVLLVIGDLHRHQQRLRDVLRGRVLVLVPAEDADLILGLGRRLPGHQDHDQHWCLTILTSMQNEDAQ